MENKKKYIWILIVLIIVGGIWWKNGGFDGTIMERLFPALVLGFVGAVAIGKIMKIIFTNSTTLWVIGAIIAFIAAFLLYMLRFKTLLLVAGLDTFVVLGVLLIVRWFKKP